jgi:hypothetical protein
MPLEFFMPLFTYIVSYKGSTHVAQGSHSNFNGFAMTWATGIPATALPALTPVLRKELKAKAYGGFVAAEGVKHVWKKTLQIGNADLVVHAVQTER